jgi:fibronectin-binding autotransporter adhesin
MRSKDLKTAGVACTFAAIGALFTSEWAAAAPVSWSVDADGDWQTATNWSSNPLLPNTADDVTIDVGGVTARTITVSGAVPGVHGLVSEENLTLNGGSLDIGAGGGLVNGALSMTPGSSLTVQQGMFSANGATTMDGGWLTVGSGGALSLPAVTSYTTPIYGFWLIDGASSTLTANALTTISATAGFLEIRATGGGQANLNALTQGSGVNGAVVRYRSYGAGSSVSIPNVTSLEGASIEVKDSGEITTSQLQSVTVSTIDVYNSAPNFNALTNVDGSTINVSGTSTLNLSAVTTANASGVSISGTSAIDLSAVATANGSSFSVQDANTISLPSLTSYTTSTYAYWVVDGASSALTANALTTISATAGFLEIRATGGGQVNLNALTQGSGVNGAVVRYRSYGAGSSVSIPNVTSFQGASIELKDSGAMTTSQLQSVTSSTIDVYNSAPNFSGLTNINGSTINITGSSTLNLSAVTNANGSSFSVFDANALSLSGVTSYTASGNDAWQVDGAGSTLSLNALTTINATAGYLQITPSNGGHVNLSGLMQIDGANGYYVRFAPTGTDTLVDSPALSAITGGIIEPRDDGVVKLPSGTVTTTQTTVSTATGGKVDVGTLVLQTGSVLFGDGNGIGSIVNTAGRVAPGLSPGILTLTGTYSQANAGTLAMDVDGPVIGTDTDRLVVAGAASLDGKLEVTLPDMFTTALGTTYDILTASSVSGSFTSSTGRLVNPQIFLGIQYLSDRVRLKAANAGDVNLDGVVNIFDINLVSSTWNTGSPSGDANTDGSVNIFDINLISSNWGAHAGSATAVPEPSALLLLAFGAIVLLVRRRR